MLKKLSIRALSADSLHFIGKNFALLLVWTFLSFIASYAFSLSSFLNDKFLMAFYAVYIYLFYYFFIGLYFGQNDILSKRKFAECLLRFAALIAFSLFVLILARFGFVLLRHLGRSLIIFPNVYNGLRYILHNPYTYFLYYFGTLVFLTFSFFIPSFSWVSTLNGRDNTILSAYQNVQHYYLKTLCIFLILYGILPLITSYVGLLLGRTALSAFNALLSVFQLVVFLHLYEFFYHK